ncbi:MAG: MFS transporter [Candidatus Binatia bacterium]|nr:MFS transporter [Candidatus Binatia bacterium]
MSEPAITNQPEESMSGKLSWGVKLAYGGPSFAGAAMAIPIGIFMPVFYSDVVLAPLGMIALATAMARALDALTDPVVGWLSDKTRTRYGRRKPWILAGTPLAALFFWLLFSPPEGLDPSSAVLWFGTMFALFFLFQTIEGVPLAALGAELTPDYKERNSVFGVRALFIALGTMVAALVPAILTGQLGPGREREIFSGMSATYGVVWLALMCIMLAVVSEHREYAERPTNPLVPGVRRALRNRPFAILLLSGVVGAIPGAVPAVLMPYFVRYVLQPEDPVVWTGTFLFLYLGTGLLFVPLWLWVAQKFGKLRAFISATCVGVSASLLYFFAGPGDLVWVGAVYFVSGTQAMAGTFLIPAMAADVIDYDELRTGLRREAQYTSFWSVIPKLVSIPGYSIPLALLAGVGYVPNEVQTAEVQFTISFLYSLFPAAFFVAALVIVSRYPISEEIHAQIRDGIGAHARGEVATDPLTQEELPPHRLSSEEVAEAWFLDNFSAGELRGALLGGASVVVRKVYLAASLAFLVCVVSAGLAAAGVPSLASDPHPLSVVGVVVAGLAFTAFVFHAMRIGAARRLVEARPSREVIEAHLVATAN